MEITFGLSWFHDHYVKHGDWNQIVSDLTNGDQKVYENQMGSHFVIREVIPDSIDGQRIIVNEFMDENMAKIAIGHLNM